ncbi:DUF4386 domain-containing protein [Cryptosporangium sp. NPDC048952]|uniref:DUF4386 domain-containing protein n=1 Tax=Cryptosporangium sp. NPDC048952 TaxID=3363961 RepID=UPI00371EC7A4
MRRTAMIAGVFYVLTFVSVPTITLYDPTRDTGFVTTPGSGTAVVVGCVLELVVALACVGTAVALYPVLRTVGEGRALGFVAARVVEATVIVVGVASVLTAVHLKRTGAGTEVTGRTLVAFYDSAFLVSQSLVPAVNAVLLGTLLYQSRLVPRVLPILGLIGAPLLVASVVGVLFDAWDRLSPVAAAAALPIATWEFALGVYLLTRGFRDQGSKR